jgi:hypothetical protein
MRRFPYAATAMPSWMLKDGSPQKLTASSVLLEV